MMIALLLLHHMKSSRVKHEENDFLFLSACTSLVIAHVANLRESDQLD
jgi:hypothetical protein